MGEPFVSGNSLSFLRRSGRTHYLLAPQLRQPSRSTPAALKNQGSKVLGAARYHRLDKSTEKLIDRSANDGFAVFRPSPLVLSQARKVGSIAALRAEKQLRTQGPTDWHTLLLQTHVLRPIHRTATATGLGRTVGLLKSPFCAPQGQHSSAQGESLGTWRRSRLALKGRYRAPLALTGLPCLPDPFPGLRPGLGNSSLSGSASRFFNRPALTVLCRGNTPLIRGLNRTGRDRSSPTAPLRSGAHSPLHLTPDYAESDAPGPAARLLRRARTTAANTITAQPAISAAPPIGRAPRRT